jgi:hypothetical protein
MLSAEVLDRDTRILTQYLEDILEVERKGIYPEYSKKRKFIILYWEKAIKKGLVSPDDKMYEAVEKMRRAKQHLRA